jgi:hypothetical protein
MFANPLSSLPKTIVIFAGEFEASSLCFDSLPYTIIVLFVFFVVLVAIFFLLNLLKCLAVNDTGEIRRNAENLSLVARAKLISRIERLVYPIRKLFCICVEKKEAMFVIYPNRRNGIGSAALRYVLNIIGKKKGA